MSQWLFVTDDINILGIKPDEFFHLSCYCLPAMCHSTHRWILKLQMNFPDNCFKYYRAMAKAVLFSYSDILLQYKVISLYLTLRYIIVICIFLCAYFLKLVSYKVDTVFFSCWGHLGIEGSSVWPNNRVWEGLLSNT